MINYKKFECELVSHGMDEKRAKSFADRMKADEEAFCIEENKKRWALEKGFLPGRVELYDLNEDNYNNYVPEYNYFKLHPLNHHFRIWINDKLTLKYVLNNGSLADTMPEYYIYVENDGAFTYLMDFPESVAKDESVLIELLKMKKVLALKPNSGTSCGVGFIKLEIKDGGKIFENNKPISEERLLGIQEDMRNYIITEYTKQHPLLADIWKDSECTLRVIMCKGVPANSFEAAPWSCAVSYARFGTSVSGAASNFNAGGIAVGFDYESGKLNETGYQQVNYSADKKWKLYAHPDTGAKWNNVILPNWEYVKMKIEMICNYISSLSYLGLDIIITENDMKLCEINSLPFLGYEQVICGPTLEKENIKEFFVSKGLFDIDSHELYQAYENSRE